jgi:alkaline phosphatase D
MLGNAQLKWLKTGLLNSSAKFKVLASGSTWVADKGPGGDAWSSYQWERDELFSWIMKSQIQGVFLISGDTHTGELNVAPAENNRSYDLFDFVASPLAQQPGNDWLFHDAMRVRLPYNAGENFGLLEFDTTGDTPNVSMRLISALGKDVWQPLQLRSEDLQNGKSVWKSLQSGDAANWLQRVTD